MPLSLICGPFQPNLEKSFIDHIQEISPGLGRPVAIVTPSQRMSNRLQNLLARDKKLSFLNIRFHTFYSLALEVAEGFDWSDYTLISDDIFYDRLIDHIIYDEKVKKSAKFHGLSSSYRSTFRDLMEAGIDPVHYKEHFPDLIKNKIERQTFEDLINLYAKYQDKLEELGVLSIPGLVKMSTESLEDGRSESLSKYKEIIYYGFYDLNSLQADFFTSVATNYPVTLFFPYRKDHPAFRFVDRFYQVKLQIAGVKPTHLPATTEECALGESLNYLFDPSKSPDKTLSDKNIRIMNASGESDEIWMIAKAIMNLKENSESPLNFDQIGVVARNLEPYRNSINEIFTENAIPYSLEEGEPILRYPIAKLALSLLTIRMKEVPITSVLDILESPYFRSYGFQGKSKGDELIRNWKRLFQRLGLYSGWAQWQGKLTPWTKKDFYLNPEDKKDSKNIIPKEDTAALWLFLEELYEQLDPSKELRGWSQKVEYARNILQEYFDVSGNSDDANAWDETLAALESLKVFDRFDPISTWTDFLETFEEKLFRTIRKTTTKSKGVQFLNAMDARSESFKILFVTGLKEGVFPRGIREDPLLRDSTRSLLQQPGGYWILPKLSGYEEEKLLFYLITSSASDRLYCVFSRSNEVGRAEVPSVYLRELCRTTGRDLEGGQTDRLPRQPYAKLKSIPFNLLTPKEASLLIIKEKVDPQLLYEPLGIDSRWLKESLGRVLEMNRFDEAASMDGRIGAPTEFLQLLTKKGLSPSALDAFKTCPFQFFMERVLEFKNESPLSQNGEFSPRLKGILYHKILQFFYKELWESKYWSEKSASSALWNESLDKTIENVFKEFSWQELGIYPLLWYSVKQQMTQHLRLFVDRDMAELRESHLIPIYLEQTFMAGIPALKGLKFLGRPDRIDWDPQGKRFRIVDYKSRKKKKNLAEMVVNGDAHQPALYLEIISRCPPFSSSGAKSLGTFYYILESDLESLDKNSVQEFSTETWENIKETFLKNLTDSFDQVKKGEFVISPEEGIGGHCQYCSFFLSCRKAHPPTRRRADKFNGLTNASLITLSKKEGKK